MQLQRERDKFMKKLSLPKNRPSCQLLLVVEIHGLDWSFCDHDLHPLEVHGVYEISTQQQNGNPRKPLARPYRSPQCQTLHNCCTLYQLHLAFQCPVTSWLATHTLAGLCALWLPSAASSSGNLHNPAKPQAPQTTVG